MKRSTSFIIVLLVFLALQSGAFKTRPSVAVTCFGSALIALAISGGNGGAALSTFATCTDIMDAIEEAPNSDTKI